MKDKESKYSLIVSLATLILVLVLLVGSITWIKPVIKVNEVKPIIDVPTAKEIAEEVQSLITLPTAEEIASKVDTPDTYLSVRDEKKVIAENLVLDEIENRDFRNDLVSFIEDETDAEDIERDDITNINVRDIDVSVYGDSAKVEVTLKVYFNNFGDNDEQEYARILVEFEVDDLIYDDDYEDADVEDYSFEEVLRTSFD